MKRKTLAKFRFHRIVRAGQQVFVNIPNLQAYWSVGQYMTFVPMKWLLIDRIEIDNNLDDIRRVKHFYSEYVHNIPCNVGTSIYLSSVI